MAYESYTSQNAPNFSVEVWGAWDFGTGAWLEL